MTIPVIHTLNPAYQVIEELGGKREVADALALDKSTLSRWCKEPPGGTGGVIPQRYWPQLLKMARAKGVDISVRELAGIGV